MKYVKKSVGSRRKEARYAPGATCVTGSCGMGRNTTGSAGENVWQAVSGGFRGADLGGV